MREAGGSLASHRRAAAMLVYGLLTIGTWVLLAPQTRLNQDQGLGGLCEPRIPSMALTSRVVPPAVRP
jgi:hypothetical protein